MYIGGPEKYFEKTNFKISSGRIGHSITVNANPVMTVYPMDAYRNFIEFPVFV